MGECKRVCIYTIHDEKKRKGLGWINLKRIALGALAIRGLLG